MIRYAGVCAYPLSLLRFCVFGLGVLFFCFPFINGGGPASRLLNNALLLWLLYTLLTSIALSRAVFLINCGVCVDPGLLVPVLRSSAVY